MAGLNRDLIDLDRWHRIQFAITEVAVRAVDRDGRYRAELAAEETARWARHGAAGIGQRPPRPRCHTRGPAVVAALR